MRVLGPVLLASCLSSVLGADDVYLVGGGKISGEIVERSASRIVVETGPGRVTLPMARVTRVEAGRSALSEFRARARSLQPGDHDGWVALGRWANQRDLGTQAREAYERALAADPGSAEANAGLGRVQTDGRWLTQEESQRAKGLVPFEGSWVTPAELEATRRERSEADLSERAAREADARVREAEARARTAEAEAQRAEAEAATDPQYDDGIPYWPYAYGGGRDYRPRPEPRPDRDPHPNPAPPERKPKTTSLNGPAEDTSAEPSKPKPAPIRKR
jgi:hypothetical protein